MSRLLPFKSEPTQSPDGPRVLSLEDDATDEALSALSSDTAREILSLVYEEPRTPPEIRDEIGSSLQNVHYHLENLEEADLIQPAGSGYSEKGTEMTVYAPASEAVVLFAGAQDEGGRLQTALTRLLGAVGLLALASLVVRRVARTLGGTSLASGGAGGADGGHGAQSGGDAGAPATESMDGGGDGGGVSIASEETQTATDAAMDTAEPAGTPTPDPAGTPTPQGTPDPAGTPTAAPSASPTPMDTPASTPAESIATPTPSPTASPTPEPTLTGGGDLVGAAGDGGLLADPAVAFFFGGLFMIAVGAAWLYLAR